MEEAQTKVSTPSLRDQRLRMIISSYRSRSARLADGSIDSLEPGPSGRRELKLVEGGSEAH